MPFNFMEASKFKTWNGLFPFKQLQQSEEYFYPLHAIYYIYLK